MIVILLGCDGGPTVEPTTASRKLWCEGQELDPELLKRLPAPERDAYIEARGCVWGGAPPPPSPEPESVPSAPPPSEYSVPVSTETADGSLVFQFNVDVAGMLVPVRYTIDAKSRAHPDYVAALESMKSVDAALSSGTVDGPNYYQNVANKIETLASVRLVLRELGDTDAALGIAVVILGLLTQNRDHLTSLRADQTSLVATFPDAGTGYCDQIASGIHDQVTRLRIFNDCMAEEMTHFLIVESLAETGRWVETESCVSFAQVRDHVGSYKVLAECLRDKHQPK